MINFEIELTDKGDELEVIVYPIISDVITSGTFDDIAYKTTKNPYKEVIDSEGSGKKYKIDVRAEEMFKIFISKLLGDIKDFESEPDPLIIIDNNYEFRTAEYGHLSYYILFYVLNEAGNGILIDNKIILRQSNHDYWEGRVKDIDNFRDTRIDDSDHLTYEHHRDVILKWVKRRVDVLRRKHKDDIVTV